MRRHLKVGQAADSRPESKWLPSLKGLPTPVRGRWLYWSACGYIGAGITGAFIGMAWLLVLTLLGGESSTAMETLMETLAVLQWIIMPGLFLTAVGVGLLGLAIWRNPALNWEAPP